MLSKYTDVGTLRIFLIYFKHQNQYPSVYFENTAKEQQKRIQSINIKIVSMIYCSSFVVEFAVLCRIWTEKLL